MPNLEILNIPCSNCDFKAFVGLEHLHTIIINEQTTISDLRDLKIFLTLPALEVLHIQWCYPINRHPYFA